MADKIKPRALLALFSLGIFFLSVFNFQALEILVFFIATTILVFAIVVSDDMTNWRMALLAAFLASSAVLSSYEFFFEQAVTMKILLGTIFIVTTLGLIALEIESKKETLPSNIILFDERRKLKGA